MNFNRRHTSVSYTHLDVYKRQVEGYKVGYCYREEPDGGWDSGWRFTAGDESEAYMDDPNNAGIYKLNTICNDDPDIIPLLNNLSAGETGKIRTYSHAQRETELLYHRMV